MKRANEWYNADFNPTLFFEAWKVIIFGAGSENEYLGLKPKNAAMLSATSSFFYEIICKSTSKEIKGLQDNFWRLKYENEFVSGTWKDHFYAKSKENKEKEYKPKTLDEAFASIGSVEFARGFAAQIEANRRRGY